MVETVQEICDKCKKDVEITIKDFEAAMKADELILCPDCFTEAVDAEAEEMPKRCFEYWLVSTLSGNDMMTHDVVKDQMLNELGQVGWELVTVDNGVAYFKREYLA